MFLLKDKHRFIVSEIKFRPEIQTSGNNVTVMEPFTDKKSFIQKNIVNGEAESPGRKGGCGVIREVLL